MKQCLFCYEKLNDRQAAIRHLEVAHQLVKGAVPQEGNPGDFYQPEGCSNWQPGDKRCRCCKGSLRMNWHSLSPALVDLLAIAGRRVKEQGGLNEIHKRDLELNTSQYGNFQKLRYFGLITHVDDEGTAWLITRQGWSFLRGDWQAASRVQTYQNRIMQRDPKRVTVHDVMRKRDQVDYWPSARDFDFELASPQLGLAL